MHFLRWLLGRKKSREIKKNLQVLVGSSVYKRKQIAETHMMELEKWVEGERIHKDPGDDFGLQWIEKHGRDFHERFVQSKCRVCSNVYKCKHVLFSECTTHIPELSGETVSVLRNLLLLLLVNGVLKKEDILVSLICAYCGISLESLYA
jgi:hypothetical protein